jgi:hypothetical protein
VDEVLEDAIVRAPGVGCVIGGKTGGAEAAKALFIERALTKKRRPALQAEDLRGKGFRLVKALVADGGAAVTDEFIAADVAGIGEN